MHQAEEQREGIELKFYLPDGKPLPTLSLERKVGNFKAMQQIPLPTIGSQFTAECFGSCLPKASHGQTQCGLGMEKIKTAAPNQEKQKQERIDDEAKFFFHRNIGCRQWVQ